MKLLLVTVFRKTYLFAFFLAIVAHIAYPYLYDFPYLLVLKMILLFIWMVVFVGFVLYLKYPQICPQGVLLKPKSSLQTTYRIIERFFYYSLAIYVFLPKSYIFPNYIILLISGVFLGCRIAIKANNCLKS